MKQQERGNNGRNESAIENNATSIGLDVGTSRIVYASGLSEFTSQLNAFLAVANSEFTEEILTRNKMDFYVKNGDILVYGTEAEKLADMFNKETRRPMRYGLLNPNEEEGFEVLKVIVRDLLKKHKRGTAKVYFSVPGCSSAGDSDLIYHEGMIKKYLNELGFQARSVNEGLAVVYAELVSDSFTGIGISLGGGVCNACLACLSIPVVTFRLAKAGDWIDESVASVTGEVATHVRVLKETGLDLSKPPKNKIEEALHIYYEELIHDLVTSLKNHLATTRDLPRLEKPIPIVLSGGTSKPKGFRDKFEAVLSKSNFPLEISHVRMAADPLNTTAKGALIAARTDSHQTAFASAGTRS